MDWIRPQLHIFADRNEAVHPIFRGMEVERMELFIPFQTFPAAAMEEEPTEPSIPFRTILHSRNGGGADGAVRPVSDRSRSKTLIDYNSTLRRWFKGHEDSLESS